MENIGQPVKSVNPGLGSVRRSLNSAKYAKDNIRKTTGYLTIVPRVQRLFSAKLALNSIILGRLPQPRLADQRANPWHTAGSLSPDVTPCSVSLAPRSSDPRFRPCNRVIRCWQRGERSQGGPYGSAGLVPLVKGRNSQDTEPKTQEECRCVNLQGAQRRAGGA